MTRNRQRWLQASAALLLSACADPSAPAPHSALQPESVLSSLSTTATRGSVTRTVGAWQVTITDLGFLPGGTFSTAYDINDLGEVLGIAADASGMNRRVLWSNGVIVDTLPQPGSAVTRLTQMNERRQFVGFANQGSGGIGYGVFVSGGVAVKLQPLPGSTASGAAANGINALGEVAGGGTGGGGTVPTYQHAGIWRNGLLYRDIGVIPGGNYSMAYDINDAGQVTGTGTAGGTGARQYAFRWENGVFTILPDLRGAFQQSVGRSINARGDIAGQSNGGEPVVWSNGSVQPLPMPVRLANQVYEINDSGDVVGTVGNVGVLWRGGQYIPLDPWPGASVNNSVARGINNAGVVVGESYFEPGQGVHAVSWTVTPIGSPINTPPTVSLAATTSTSIVRGGSVTVRGTVADPDAGGGPWPWVVAWGKGNGQTSGTLAAPGSFVSTRKFTTAGTFAVRAKVTDGSGATATSNTVTVTVR